MEIRPSTGSPGVRNKTGNRSTSIYQATSRLLEITNGPAWGAKYAILRGTVNNKPKGRKPQKNQGLAGYRAL